MVGFGLSEAQAGFVVMAEAASVGLTAMIVSPLMKSWSRRSLTYVASALVLGANLLSAYAPLYEALIVYRILSGIGCGVAVATSKATVADSRSPERFFAFMLVFAGLGLALLLKVLAYVADIAQHRGVFLTLATTVLLLSVLLIWLPGRPSSEVLIQKSQNQPPAQGGGRWSIAMVLLAVLVNGTGIGALWGFSERIASSAGISSDLVGTAMLITSLFGVITALAVALIGDRTGKTLPLVIGLLTQGAGAVMLSYSNTYAVYFAGLALFQIGWYLHFPYFVAIAAMLDAYGRLIAVFYGIFLLSISFGPGLAGLFVERVGFAPVGLMTLAGSILTLFVCATVLASMKWSNAETVIPKP